MHQCLNNMFDCECLQRTSSSVLSVYSFVVIELQTLAIRHLAYTRLLPEGSDT